MKTTALILGSFVLGGAVLLAQAPTAPVTMNNESHFERLTYLRHMRVFEARIAPGESTGDYLLDHDVMSIPFSDTTLRSRRVGQDWEAPRARTEWSAEAVPYTEAPVTQRVENTGTTPLRMFLVENLRDRGWTMPAALTAPGTTLRQETRSFAIYDIRLDTATPQTNHVHPNPSFIFVVSGVVRVQGGGGESEFRLEEPGRWFPSSGPDQPHTLRVVGNSAHAICVEAR
jgi:quercetin dioxygenase-like cupin family protein